MELNINNITKRFKDITAVDDVSLALGPGVWGLLGANGAGKTTLMRMVAGILDPSGGSVQLDGVDIRTLGERYRDLFGYLPQTFGFYPEFTVGDYLEYVAALKGLDNTETGVRIAALLDMVGLEQLRKKPIRKLSGGMQRRVGIAQALLNDPRILILDEPTSGLDPGERVYFRNILSQLAQDRMVLISTHIVADVEYIASCNAVMKRGRLIAVDTTENLVKRVEGMVWQAAVPAAEVPRWEQSLCVANLRSQEDGKVQLRYVAQTPVVPASLPAAARLEDMYLWEFRDETAGRGERT